MKNPVPTMVKAGDGSPVPWAASAGESLTARWARRSFLVAAGVTGAVAPWLLGGVPAAAQWALLVGAILTAATGFWVRASCPHTQSGRAAWKVERMSLLCGIALLILMLVQALNPAFNAVAANEELQLVRLQSVEWAPQSILVPFDGGAGPLANFKNAWRYLLIFGVGTVYAAGLAAGFRERGNARRWAWIMGANAVALALVSLAHWASGAESTLWMFHSAGDATGGAIFFQKSHNGAFFAALVALGCGLAASAKGRKDRRAWESVALLLWVATVVVDSGVATVCATAWGGIYATMRWRARADAREEGNSHTWARVGIVGLLLAGLLALAGAGRALARFSVEKDSFWEEARGGHMRVMMREIGLAMWMDRPLTGWGGGAFPSLYDIYQHRVTSMKTYLSTLAADAPRPGGSTADCDWVEFLVEYGVVGLVLLFAVTALHVRWWIAWRGWRQPLSRYLLLGSLGVLLHACFDSILRNPALLLLFAGMQIAAVRLAAPAKGKRPSPSRRRVGDNHRQSP